MFDYDLAHWGAFVSAAILLSVSPGPDMAFMLAHTARGGVRAGLTALAGILTGVLGHIALTAAGLSAVLATSAVAFSVVKWAGAAYLVYLGITMLLTKGESTASLHPPPPAPAWQIYRQGILVDLLNPKVALFFLAFLPQFVVPGAGPVWVQLLLHGVLLLAIAAAIEPLLVVAAAWLARTFGTNGRLRIWVERGLGTVLVALGIRLVLAER